MSRLINFFKKPRNAFLSLFALLLFVASLMLRIDTLHVSLAAEPLLDDGPAWMTNSLLTTLVVDLIIIALALATRFSLKMSPTGFGNFMELVVEALYGLVESVAGKRARVFFPWVATIFIFVILSNYIGLIPGVGSIVVEQTPAHGEEKATEGHGSISNGELAMADGGFMLFDTGAAASAEDVHVKEVPLFRSPSADLNLTFALALITMVMVQFWGVQALGLKYFKKFFNFNFKDGIGMGIIMAVVGILELIGEFAKIISFAFRLFGNIFAGEVLLAVMAYLVTFLLPMPFYGLELFVGFIQALVFMMLATVFFSIATISHDQH